MSITVIEPATLNLSDCTIKQVIRQVKTMSHSYIRGWFQVTTCGMVCLMNTGLF